MAEGNANAWDHMNRARIIDEVRDRLRDPMIIHQSPTGLCGPLSIVMEFARRKPARYVSAVKELLETGKLTCATGRVIRAEEELRQAPVIAGKIGQVDWLLAATMRDDANVWEDVDDDANGLESITLWGAQRGWTRDLLDLPTGAWETCFFEGDVGCMRMAQEAVKARGTAFFLIDANLIKKDHVGPTGGVVVDVIGLTTPGPQENVSWQTSRHKAREEPGEFSEMVPSKADNFPPDHWVVYLGGLRLGSDPDDDDLVNIRLWSWGGEYKVSGTIDAFTEYLYGVVTGES
ncbi:MAG: hypothetical protein KY456_16200 [Chloroflexi bacterium]|nr:hypothetical protein [Chloroflexota bacterium]